MIKAQLQGDFPGGLVVKTLLSNAGGVSSIPGYKTKIPTCLAVHPKKKKKAVSKTTVSRLWLS